MGYIQPLAAAIPVGDGGGMANPMTAVGDIVVGGTVSGGVAAPARLGAGSSGFVLRSISGTPAWREISAAGLAADRPGAIANREGQTYWSTDAAAGAQLSICLHKGGTTYGWESLVYGTSGFPVATGAGEVLISTGAGTTYAASPISDEIGGVLAAFLGGTAGQTVIGDGAGDVTMTSAPVSAVLAASDAPGMRSALGVSYAVTASKTTTYTAVPGDIIPCDATGGAFTVNLPAASGVVQSISIKKTDASINAITIDGNGAETIDGAATRLLSTQYEAVTLWSNGTNWLVF
jgi:hypothetical protein